MEFILRKNIYVFVRGRSLEACWFQPHVFPARGDSPGPAWGSCRNNCTGSFFLQCEVVGSFRAEIRSPLPRLSKEGACARLLPSSSRLLQGRLRLRGFSVFPGYVAQTTGPTGAPFPSYPILDESPSDTVPDPCLTQNSSGKCV